MGASVSTASAAPEAALRVADLTVCYDRHPAVHHLDGAFARGSLTALVGPNGAGKSTLIKTLAGLMHPHTGRVERGTPAREIAYLPQHAELDRSFPLRVRDVVELGLWQRRGAFRGLGPGDRRAAAEALAAVGLDGFASRPVNTLSCGQFQRVLFARVLLQDAPVILLDEPFNAIDARTTADLLGIIQRWHGEARTVIAVLHDLDQVRSHFPETLLLARGAVDWGPTERVLAASNLFRARQMAEAWDEQAPVCARSV